MSFSIKFQRTATKERLATVGVQVHLSPTDLALLLLDAIGGLYDPGDDDFVVKVTEKAVREALARAMDTAIEDASYRAGDNDCGDRVKAVKEAIVARFFDGREHNIPTPAKVSG